MPRLLRPLSAIVLASVSTLAVGGYVGMHHVLADTEQSLLAERSSTVGTLLQTAGQELLSSMRLLGAAADGDKEPGASAALFRTSYRSGALLGQRSVGAARASGSGFVVVESAGTGPAVGQPVPAGLAEIFTRATKTAYGSAAMVTVDGARQVILADRVGSVVVWTSTAVPGTTPVAKAINPFRNLHGAFYLGDAIDDGHVILTTDSVLPVHGHTTSVKVPLADTHLTLVAATDKPLVGGWNRRAPLMILVAGLLLALAVTSVIEMLARRRDYAATLVEDATSDLAEANDDLERARSFLDRLVTAGPVVVLRLDLERHVTTYVSPNVEARFGYALPAVRAAGFPFDRIDIADRPRFDDMVAATASGAATSACEVRLLRADGVQRWVSVMAVPDIDGGASLLLYLLDVDEQHRAEEATRVAMQLAQQANASKGEFLSRASHELRTPLNAVLGYGQVLETEDLTEDQAHSVRQILVSGRHLLNLIDEVLDMSRHEATELDLRTEPVALAPVVTAVVGMVAPLAETSHITVRADTATDAIAWADPQRTRQVLLNLMTNAVKYNRPGGVVSVHCDTTDDGWVRLDVVDTGVGIAAEDLERAFSPFERLGAVRTDIEGEGIGLPLARHLAEAMGGSLTVVSTLHSGSTFTLSLPAGPPLQWRPTSTPELVIPR